MGFMFEIFSRIYSWLGWFRLQCYRLGIFSSRRLPVPVICVGDLVLGGSGKTPVVIYLAAHFQREGLRVAVLCSSPAAKDEVVLLERRLPGVIVLSGRNRFTLGRHAVEKLNADLLIMDGGFQHLGLTRDLNLVLITGDLFSPRQAAHQILREPVSGIRRANLCLLTKVKNGMEREVLETRIHQIAPELPVLQTKWSADGFFDERGKEVSIDAIRGKSVFGFAGIADGEGFLRQLEALGVHPVEKILFNDHHPYSLQDFKKICDRARACGAEILATTEKDLVKISKFSIKQGGPPLYAVRLRVELMPEAKIIFDLLKSSYANPQKAKSSSTASSRFRVT